jgi:hypothetical protein
VRKRPERVLLFRSGRHLGTALDALAAQSPGCQVTVVATPGATAALDAAGIPAARRLIYTRTPFFQPWAFLWSRTGAKAMRGGFDRVCVLWTDPHGRGHANVDHTALLLSPRGFTAITADGQLIPRAMAPALRRELIRAAKSTVLTLVVGACVSLPARILRPLRAR